MHRRRLLRLSGQPPQRADNLRQLRQGVASVCCKAADPFIQGLQPLPGNLRAVQRIIGEKAAENGLRLLLRQQPPRIFPIRIKTGLVKRVGVAAPVSPQAVDDTAQEAARRHRLSRQDIRFRHPGHQNLPRLGLGFLQGALEASPFPIVNNVQKAVRPFRRVGIGYVAAAIQQQAPGPGLAVILRQHRRQIVPPGKRHMVNQQQTAGFQPPDMEPGAGAAQAAVLHIAPMLAPVPGAADADAVHGPQQHHQHAVVPLHNHMLVKRRIRRMGRAQAAERPPAVAGFVGEGTRLLLPVPPGFRQPRGIPYTQREQPLPGRQHRGFVHHHIVADAEFLPPGQRPLLRMLANRAVKRMIRHHGPGQPQPPQRIQPTARVKAPVLLPGVDRRNRLRKSVALRSKQNAVIAQGFAGFSGIKANENAAARRHLNARDALPDTCLRAVGPQRFGLGNQHDDSPPALCFCDAAPASAGS